MPPGIPDLVAPALEGLRERLGPGAEGLRLEVVGVTPLTYDRVAPGEGVRPGHARWSSRAQVTVLVCADANSDGNTAVSGRIVAGLLQLQIRGLDRLSGVDGFSLWTAMGRTPQAGFLVQLPVVAEGDNPQHPVILEPLDVLTGDLAHPNRRTAASEPNPAKTDRSS